VTVFGSDGVHGVPVERGGERIATVYGISYPTREVTENLALRFGRHDAPGVHVAMLHGSVNGIGADEHGSYSPCTVDDLRAAGMDYWALGHIHKRAELRRGAPWVVYPGNLQGRSMKPSEQGAKGATVVQVRDGRIAATEFVPCDCVRFRAVEVACEELADLPAVADAVTSTLVALADEERCEVVARVSLAGRGEVSRDLRRAGGTADLLRAVRDGLGGRGAAVWCDAIVDLTAPPLELERIRGRKDLSSEILAWAEGLMRDADAREQFIQLPWGALQKAGLVPAAHDEAADVLREAAELALSMLEEGDAA
jgi:DNA repair exonuclease SbcCD nuclease subunit